MSIIDEEIARLDEEIVDMQTAEARAKELGARPGDYDLSQAASGAKNERLKQEALQQQAEALSDPDPKSVGSITHSPDIYEKDTPKEEVEYNQDVLNRLHAAQEKMTPVLLEKFPEAAEFYGNTVKQGLADRHSSLSELGDNSYQLTHKEMKNVLGEDDFKQYTQDLGVASEFMNKRYSGAYNVKGTKEDYGEIPMYGLRSALFTQYSGPNRTMDDIKKDISDYEALFNKEKKGLDEGVIARPIQ